MAAPVNWRMAWSMIGQLPKQAGGGQWPPFRGALTACHPQPMKHTRGCIRRASANTSIRRCAPLPATITPSHPTNVTCEVTALTKIAGPHPPACGGAVGQHPPGHEAVQRARDAKPKKLREVLKLDP